MEAVRKEVQSLKGRNLRGSSPLSRGSVMLRPVLWENPGEDGVLAAQNAV